MKKIILVSILLLFSLSILAQQQNEQIFKPKFIKNELEKVYQVYSEIPFTEIADKDLKVVRKKEELGKQEKDLNDNFDKYVNNIGINLREFVKKAMAGPEQKEEGEDSKKTREEIKSKLKFEFNLEVTAEKIENIVSKYEIWYMVANEISYLLGDVPKVVINIYDHLSSTIGETKEAAHKNTIKREIKNISNIELTTRGIYFNIDYRFADNEETLFSVLKYLQAQFIKYYVNSFEYRYEDGSAIRVLDLLTGIEAIPFNVSYVYFAGHDLELCESEKDPVKDPAACKKEKCRNMSRLLVVDNYVYKEKEMDKGFEEIEKNDEEEKDRIQKLLETDPPLGKWLMQSRKNLNYKIREINGDVRELTRISGLLEGRAVEEEDVCDDLLKYELRIYWLIENKLVIDECYDFIESNATREDLVRRLGDVWGREKDSDLDYLRNEAKAALEWSTRVADTEDQTIWNDRTMSVICGCDKVQGGSEAYFSGNANQYYNGMNIYFSPGGNGLTHYAAIYEKMREDRCKGWGEAEMQNFLLKYPQCEKYINRMGKETLDGVLRDYDIKSMDRKFP